jgi:hypothetical protein
MKAQADFTHEHVRKLVPRLERGEHIGGGSSTAGYGLWALALDDRPADAVTAAVVQYLLDVQGVVRVNETDSARARREPNDGRWFISCKRPPLQISEVGATVLALAGIDRYATEEQQAAVAKARSSAAQWLATAPLQTTEDRFWRLWGLHYLDDDSRGEAETRTLLLSTQHDDGGWSQLDELDSDAYSTGQVLFVLLQTGSDSGDAEIARAVAFLLRTQYDDGSWLVKSRAKKVQPYFDNDDPFGEDQFLSVAATSWATAALVHVVPRKPTAVAP